MRHASGQDGMHSRVVLVIAEFDSLGAKKHFAPVLLQPGACSPSPSPLSPPPSPLPPTPYPLFLFLGLTDGLLVPLNSALA